MSISPSHFILHVDGDSFFASCEIAQNERLRGACVVTGADRGIATSMSYEAKKKGVMRGMTRSQVMAICPEAIITSSNYDVYSIYSRRMYAIVRRYASVVEEYSIDECFAVIDSIVTAQKIQHELERDLGMTFSVGVAPTKTLAKVASKLHKPAGFAVIVPQHIQTFLKNIPIGKIWGIGSSTSHYLQRQQIHTALDFCLQSELWITEHLAKPYHEIWHELNGRPIKHVYNGANHKYSSIMKTRTFKPTTEKSFVFSALTKNLEQACAKLRAHNFVATTVYFYLKTQKFSYKGYELCFLQGISNPHEIMFELEKHFNEIFMVGIEYRATGIVLRTIKPRERAQADLFGNSTRIDTLAKLYTTVDSIIKKHGYSSLFLARSAASRKKETEKYPHVSREIEQFHKMGIPFWGNVV